MATYSALVLGAPEARDWLVNGTVGNSLQNGAANPYLAYAAMLAAGLDGVERKIDPGAANSANLYEAEEQDLRRRNIGFLPTTLQEAIDGMSEDDIVKEALGADYARYYLDVKRAEWNEYHRSVSQWELDRYLKTY